MEYKNHVGEKDQEIAPADILSDFQQGGLATEASAAQSRRVLLKIDSIVMPLIVVAMTLAFLDKPTQQYMVLKKTLLS
ncbi:unnamed protein product [Penicillium pancosmium]